jgi:hypothetical protein
MTREQKLEVNLESLIFDDLPHGTRLSGPQIRLLTSCASEDQRRRAFEQGLVRSPLLLDDERVLREGDLR